MWLFVQPLISLLTPPSSAHVQIALALETSNIDAAITTTSIRLIEDSRHDLIN